MPYADFALFGPYRKRLLKKLMFTAFTYSVQTGEWQRQQLPGPFGFSSPWTSWMVHRAAALHLGIASPEPLDLYGEYIGAQCDTLGHDVWFLIYQADSACGRKSSSGFGAASRRATIAG